MKVLVTGGAGFIGLRTVNALLQDGHEAIILDSLNPRVHPRQDTSRVPAQVEAHYADLLNRDVLGKLLQRVDAVIHLAAYQDYLQDFSQFFHVNSAGTALIYELIAEHKCDIHKVVVASTQAVYGEGQYACREHGKFAGTRSMEQLERGDWEVRCPLCGGPAHFVPLTEADARPATPYGISKYAGEQFALTMGGKLSIPTACLRYSLVQGPGQSIHNAYSGIGRIFNQQLINDRLPSIYEDGHQVRDFIHVDDVAAANLLVMKAAEASGSVFNVGGERPTSVNEYVDVLLGLYGRGPEREITGLFRMGDARHTFSSSERLLALGWQRQHSLKWIVADAKDWFQQAEKVNTNFAARAVMEQQGVLRRTQVGQL